MIASPHISKATPACPRIGRDGFSLLEIFVTVTIIAAIATVAVSIQGSNVRYSVQNTRLQADVVMLNQMVSLYLADGGSVDGMTTEQAVLDKLKRARPAAEARRQTGVSTGRFIDVRLKATLGSGPLPPGQLYRASWNSSTHHFDLVAGAGVDQFDLDESYTEIAFPLDTRQVSSKQYNSSNGWIWGGTGSDGGVNYVTPSLVTVKQGGTAFDPDAPVGTGGSSGSSGGGSGGGGSTPPVTPPTQLPSPTMVPAGGSFPYDSFPGTVILVTNGVTSGPYTTQYRVNGGGWQLYTTPISVSSGTVIEAQNLSSGPTVSDSGVNGQGYYRLVSGFAATETGSWTSPAGGPNLVTTTTPGDPTTTFAHGNTQLDLGNGQFLDAGTQNTLTFTQTGFSDVSPNTTFTLGTLVMLNGTTFNNSEANAVTLHLTLTFTHPPGTQTIDIPFNLISTENSTDRNASADIVELAKPNAGVAVSVDGVDYTLQLSWQSLDPSAGVVQGNQFLIFEGGSATAQLQGTLVSNH